MGSRFLGLEVFWDGVFGDGEFLGIEVFCGWRRFWDGEVFGMKLLGLRFLGYRVFWDIGFFGMKGFLGSSFFWDRGFFSDR